MAFNRGKNFGAPMNRCRCICWRLCISCVVGFMCTLVVAYWMWMERHTPLISRRSAIQIAHIDAFPNKAELALLSYYAVNASPAHPINMASSRKLVQDHGGVTWTLWFNANATTDSSAATMRYVDAPFIVFYDVGWPWRCLRGVAKAPPGDEVKYRGWESIPWLSMLPTPKRLRLCGTIGNTLAFGGGFYIAVAFTMTVRRQWRRFHRLCVHCGYPTVANSVQCSECGREPRSLF